MVRFFLRVPTSIYQAVKAQADREHRSINNQIVAILEAATKTDWVAEDHAPRCEKCGHSRSVHAALPPTSCTHPGCDCRELAKYGL